MSYTDPTAVRVVLSPGGDDADVGSAAYLSDTDLKAKIQEATDEVNAKLSGRYVVPFSPVPGLIARITTAIAAYLATLTAYGTQPLDPQHPIVLAYNRAEQLLTQLGNGSSQLAGDTVPDPSPTGTVAVDNMLDGVYFDVDDFPTGPFEPRWPGRRPTFL